MEREIESSGTSDGGESESNVTASVVGGEHVCGEDDGESERGDRIEEWRVFISIVRVGDENVTEKRECEKRGLFESILRVRETTNGP